MPGRVRHNPRGGGGAFTQPTRWSLQGFKQRVDLIIHMSSFWLWQEGWAGGLEGCGCSWGKGAARPWQAQS